VTNVAEAILVAVESFMAGLRGSVWVVHQPAADRRPGDPC
jgi:hypothetical protein